MGSLQQDLNILRKPRPKEGFVLYLNSICVIWLFAMGFFPVGLMSCSVKNESTQSQEERYPAQEDAALKTSRSSAALHQSSHKVEKTADDRGHSSSPQLASSGIFQSLKAFFEGIQQKVDALASLESENEALKAENASLRLMLEKERYERQSTLLSNKTEELKATNLKLTGSERGRAPASLRFEIPYHLEPPAMAALAVSHFKARNYEQAAGLMRYVLKENPELYDPGRVMLLGISWYQLENFNEAKSAFQSIIQDLSKHKSPTAEVQARMWLALVEKRLGQDKVSKEHLFYTLNKYPKAPEIQWVNPVRGPASVEKSDSQEGESHDEGHHDNSPQQTSPLQKSTLKESSEEHITHTEERGSGHEKAAQGASH